MEKSVKVKLHRDKQWSRYVIIDPDGKVWLQIRHHQDGILVSFTLDVNAAIGALKAFVSGNQSSYIHGINFTSDYHSRNKIDKNLPARMNKKGTSRIDITYDNIACERLCFRAPMPGPGERFNNYNLTVGLWLERHEVKTLLDTLEEHKMIPEMDL